MNDRLRLVGNAAAILGIVACGVGGVARLTGHYYLGSYEVVSLFNVGTAFMIFACLVKLHVLGARQQG